MSQLIHHATDTSRYAKCIAASKRIRWDIDTDVIRGRQFDFSKKFLPDGLSMVRDIPFLSEEQKNFFSQVQGRTYANMFGLVERFICAKVLEISQEHFFGDQIALEALIRFSDEELKHQELFRRLDVMAAERMPEGYVFIPQPNDVARVVLGKSSWAVMALTLHIELFTQMHYRQSIEPDDNLSELWKDVFLYHWKEESQHAILDELEWVRIDKTLSCSERDAAITDLIDLVLAVDGILQAQAQQDTGYFVAHCNRAFTSDEVASIQRTFLKAYRWQYILSGLQVPHFNHVLSKMVDDDQGERIGEALTVLIED
ncbi:MAG: hypothetical protein EP315_07215 [Gammaproteobacteria bacterium]|nr:MAG: hypothetical protein EP315_07215 [Gammaproteobacteria bacterium]